MARQFDPGKRRFVQVAGLSGFALAGSLIAASEAAARPGEAKQDNDEGVTPPEDLMREHGVLDRVLLIYEAAIRKFGTGEDFDPAVVSDSGLVVRDFIENYHEKSEEEAVFPRFRKAGQMVPLVDTLLAQHRAGRLVTAQILQLAPTARKNEDDRRRLTGAMQTFIAMYRPHAAREDTDLFPKLRSLVTASEYDAMAEDFERKEHQHFGDDGFEKVVQRVAALEEKIGIHDLNQFTPQP